MAVDPWLRLLDAAQASRRGWLALLKRYGEAAGVLELAEAALARAGIDESSRARLRANDAERLEPARRWLAAAGHRLVGWGTPDYPPLLAELDDAPLALWVAGDSLELLAAPQLAIVGSRHPTRGGVDTAESFAKYLSERGVTITSGLATGIDAASHRGALRGCAGTVAVQGCGLDRIYPRRQRRSGPRDRGEGPAGVRAHAGHTAASTALPAAQPHHCRALARHARRRGHAAQRLVDHRTTRGRVRTRGVRRSGLDSQPTRPRLPSAAAPRRDARRGCQ